MTFPEKHGPWKILTRQSVYRDAWIALDRDEVIRPDGQPGTHCILWLKSGVSVLPMDDQGMVYLTEEFHYGVGRVTVEVVSGGIEPDEQAEVTARRELQEELGITAKEWIDLGVCDPFTSVVVSPTRLFLARGLDFGPTSLEGTEEIRCHPVQLAKAAQMVLDSEITHGPSCILILKTLLLLAQ